ncbi:MAG: Sec-independent protein translocase protein TatB [Thermodesulfobacteriota bacterium]
MFGIGLPELILILALALIVVGPDKLPDLARSVAKGILDLKKTANTLKESLTEEGNILDEIKPELEEAAQAIKDDILSDDDDSWSRKEPKKDVPSSDAKEGEAEVIDVDVEPAAEESDGEDAPAQAENKKTSEPPE